MNTGVEIILQRMKDCPEDFYYTPHRGGMTKWMTLVDHAIGEELLTGEEHDALMAGLKEAKRVRFTELVMKELAGEGEPEAPKSNPHQAMNATGLVGATVGGYTLTTNGVGQPTWANTATATINANSLTLGNQTIDEATIKHMKAHLEAMRKEKEKQHETLYGRLKNYLHPEI